MIGMTVCSGIGAPEVSAPWIDWRYQAEIEKFPSAVLAHRFPDAVNLGDMTKFKEWPNATVDVLCGGTPCQSFSVAGLRKGLADPRGNLTLTFLEIARRYRPEFIVWENVPGVVSDKDDALGQFMGGLNSLGYAIDCDILDAQYFGLAQRRRRVFFVCHNIDIGRQKRTPLFANATGQFLSEMLLSVLAEASDPSRLGASVSEWPARITRAGLMPKMRCFGAASETPPTPSGLTAFLTKLHDDWGEALSKCGSAQNTSVSSCETACAQVAGDTAEGASLGSVRERRSTNIAPSWSSISAVVCDLMSTSTTSTATRTITPSTIYICAQASLSIVQSIIRSTTSPASYFDGDGSGLTALKAFTGYARQAASDLFGNLDGLCDWHGFISEAEGAIRELERGLGDRAHTGTLFSDPEGLRWYSPPRRETRKGVADCAAHGVAIRGREGGGTAELTGDIATALRASSGGGDKPHALISPVAPTISARPTGGGGLGTDFDCDGGLVPFVSPALKARDAKGPSSDGDGDGAPLIPVAFSSKDYGGDAEENLSPTLRAGGHHGSHANAGVPPAIAIQEGATRENPDSGPQGKGWQEGAAYTLEARQRPQAVAFGLTTEQTPKFAEDIALTLTKQSPTGGGQPQACMTPGYAVRRLTPTECERLQGFPDGWTAIPWRGKPADQCPDGPRYKAIGNSWATNCGEFIFERIKAAEAMT